MNNANNAPSLESGHANSMCSKFVRSSFPLSVVELMTRADNIEIVAFRPTIMLFGKRQAPSARATIYRVPQEHGRSPRYTRATETQRHTTAPKTQKYRATERQSHIATEPRKHRSERLQSHRATEPQRNRATEPQSHKDTTPQPQSHRATKPRSRERGRPPRYFHDHPKPP